MTIDYNELEILKIEKFTGLPLIGYINPQGKIIDFSTLIGPYGHDNWKNPVTGIFLKFISYVIKDSKIGIFGLGTKAYANNHYDGFDDIVKRGLEFKLYYNLDSYDEFLNELEDFFQRGQVNASMMAKFSSSYWKKLDAFEKLRIDMLHFFHKLYSNKDFFGSLGRVLSVENKDYITKLYNIEERDEYFYHDYQVVQLMSYFKDFCVQYLGYDSIERAIPYLDLNLYNNIHERSEGYTFSDRPKTIETSCTNINERFYNWLLMDWQIQRVPRYFWNEKEKRFELEQSNYVFHQTDKEEILGKEIEAIKNQIPKDKRKAYFR